MPKYDEQINPQEPSGSAAKKSLGQMALTMGFFLGGQLLASAGYAAGKNAFLKSITKSAGASVALKKAASYATKRGSLTALISKVAKPNSWAQTLATKIDLRSTDAVAMGIRSTMKEGGMHTFQQLKHLKALPLDQKIDFGKQSLAAYAKRSAVLFPTVYAMEQAIGVSGPGPEEQKKPKWWNLPGHAIGMIKYVPTYLMQDAIGAVGMKAVPGLGSMIPDKMLEHLPKGFGDNITKGIKYSQGGEYLKTKLGEKTLGYRLANLRAGKDSFAEAIVNRQKMYVSSKHTASRYKKTGNSFRTMRESIYADYKKNLPIKRTRRMELQAERLAATDSSTLVAARRGIDDVLGLTDEASGSSSELTNIYEKGRHYSEDTTKRITNALTKQDKLPFLAKILNLRRAKASDFGQRELFDDVYKNATKIAKSKGYKEAFEGISTPEEFAEKLLTRKTFINDNTGSLIDLGAFSPKHLLNKAVRSPLAVLGNRFSVADLFPFKAMTAPEMSRIIPIEDNIAMHSSIRTENPITPFQVLVTRKGVPDVMAKYGNIHHMEEAGMALATRRAGSKNYNIYNYNPAQKDGGWTKIGSQGKIRLNSDSAKMSNEVNKSLVKSSTDGNIKPVLDVSTNPAIAWVQRNLSILDGTGSSTSLFGKVRAFLPESFNRLLSPNGGGMYRHSRISSTIKQLKNIEGVHTNNLKDLKRDARGVAMKGKRELDTFLGKSKNMSKLFNFLEDQGAITRGIKSGEEVDATMLLDATQQLLKSESVRTADGQLLSARDTRNVSNIVKSSKIGGHLVEDSLSPHDAGQLRSFMYDFAQAQTPAEGLDDIGAIFRKSLKEDFKAGRISERQANKVEFSLFYGKLRESLKGIDEVTAFKKTVQDELSRDSVTGRGSVLTTYSDNLRWYENTLSVESVHHSDHITALARNLTETNPFTIYPSKVTGLLGVAGTWTMATANRLISSSGLGWDTALHTTPGEVGKLWGKRLGAFAGLSVGYNLLDTVADTSGLFDWSMFDEGITVGLADQAVKARMASGWVYDKLGVDNAARYMEGLMPGSSKVIPGAIAGFALGGLPGAAIGAVANAYMQPQMEEGVLGFLSAVPGLNFLVSDPTLDFEELQNIYEGQQMRPVRKGKGWTLGISPIAGGRVERYEPGWYPRLKAQSKASPVLYGSKIEQFLAKDAPFIDFSLMDIINPQYLEDKHKSDRPYPISSTPFSEVPVAGPLLGATAGQLYNAIHPLGSNTSINKDAAMKAYGAGTTTNWRGESMGTYGPQYGGFLGKYNQQNSLPGNDGNKYSVMSPHSLKPLIGEQVYKGFIEPAGLPGFITSALAWGGDEPFTHIPVAESANAMDSLARSYWDSNLGDLAGTTELLRRAIPRPRSSYDKVNPIQNSMPSWMPQDFQTGDPYCLLPNTLVETSEGLLRADMVEKGILLKTLNGQYYPVERVSTRPVNEDIFAITINGLEDFPLKTTGGHPFYINGEWELAKYLIPGDRTTYPLFDVTFPTLLQVGNSPSVDINTTQSYALGLLARWTKIVDSKVLFRDETPRLLRLEIENYYPDMGEFKDLLFYLQKVGIPPAIKTANFTILLSYLEAFLVRSEINENELIFRFHTKDAVYNAWSALLQNRIASKITGNSVHLTGLPAIEVAYEMGLSSIRSVEEETTTYDSGFQAEKHGPHAKPIISSVTTEHYEGLVYTIDMGEAGTYTLPGAAVHNSKIAHGEILLPGEAYENFFNPKINFPVGMSYLGYNPYEQALRMIGLNSFTDSEENILEEGTTIHSMVQNQLMSAGLATKVEAMISDPEMNLYSWVDVMYKDPNTMQELPLEIKSISGSGFGKLKQPKWKHKVQLNSYMAAMGVQSGRFLYVSREDPTQTKEFQVRFNPKLWESTKADLQSARGIAEDFLSRGYGEASGRYSYIDRLRVLLNASPYSKQYRETEQLLEEQYDGGYLTNEEEEEFSVLQKQHKHVLRKYEMYPRRFQLSKLLNPSYDYPEDMSLNPNILPASEYSLLERAVGSIWETLTHLRSPVNAKLIGAYSPTEHYENAMIRGDFASWTTPVESFVKPWGRGLVSASDPLQGAVSWGTGGAIFGGLPGAIVGSAAGAAWGALQGGYRAVTGTKYVPKNFKDRVEMQQYFDNVDYSRNLEMYRATGDKQFLSAMRKTPLGWMLGMDQEVQQPQPLQDGYYEQGGPSTMNDMARRSYQAYNMMGSPDRGFHSPYGGTDAERAMNYDATFYSGYGALPSWDRPFWASFVDTPYDQRESVLNAVDSDMANMLKSMWGRGEEVVLPSIDNYFSKKNYPSFLNPVMDPTVEHEDIQLLTIEEAGLNAHDFGMGWKEQLSRMKNSVVSLQPININGRDTSVSGTNMSAPEIRDALLKILTRMGYPGANVLVDNSPSFGDEAILTLNIKRDATQDIIDNYYDEN